MVFGVKQFGAFELWTVYSINVYSTFSDFHPLINSLSSLLAYISPITSTINCNILLFIHFYVSLMTFLTLKIIFNSNITVLFRHYDFNTKIFCNL